MHHCYFGLRGPELRQEGGSLSIIGLRTITPENSTTYLVDVLSLRKDALRPLFDVIQSSTPTKIVFDGRMDFSELYHWHGTTMHGVLDLQLADIHSRGQRGEDRDDQLHRLSPYLHRREVFGQPNAYTAVQMLCGLDRCLREHDIITDVRRKESGEDDRLIKMKSYTVPVNHDDWLERPLPDRNLQYASRDLYLIGLLYKDFEEEGYISDQLPDQSTRYVSIWKDAKPQQMDTFKCHPLLPLQIIEYNRNTGLTRQCVGCRRSFPRDAYSIAAWKHLSKRYCWVCHAIKMRQHVHAMWEKDEDGYLYESESDD